MKTSVFSVAMALGGMLASTTWSAEHTVKVLDEPPPSEGVSKAIVGQLAETGVVVSRGESRTVCQIWLCKQWPVNASFKPTSEVLYPFREGQLVGVVRRKRKGSEFRDRDISSGVYTLRYAYQPIDGNHEGTFPTRDFLLMVRAEDDMSPEPMDVEQLVKLSSKALEASHPAMMCLLQAEGDPEALPAIRHNKDDDWWAVQLKGTVMANDQKSDLRLDLVVAGHAKE